MSVQNLKQLLDQIDFQFDRYLNHIQKRQTKGFDLSWLLNSSNTCFYPDYFTFNSIGETQLRTKLNRHLSVTAEWIWKRYILKKLMTPIFQAIQTQYIPKQMNTENRDTCEQIASIYNSHIIQKMQKQSAQLHLSTFTDFFQFMFHSFKTIESHFHFQDPYREDKTKQNNCCLNILKDIEPELKDHPNKEKLLLFLITRSNWIDSVETNAMDFLSTLTFECSTLLTKCEDLDYYNNQPHIEINKVINILKKPKNILYESDNSGEIIFDLYFIQHLIQKGHTVTLIAKKHPVMNDATQKEITKLLENPIFTALKLAQTTTFTLSHHTTIITGKYPENLNTTYIQHYQDADILLLKGQGNFHTFPRSCLANGKRIEYHYKKPHIHIMGIKAKLIHLCLSSHYRYQSPPPIQDPLIKVFES